MTTTVHFKNDRGSINRSGFSTMAYVLWFAAATFCAIIATFTLLASNPPQPMTGQPDQPVTSGHPAGHG
jgi:hypothetical protein